MSSSSSSSSTSSAITESMGSSSDLTDEEIRIRCSISRREVPHYFSPLPIERKELAPFLMIINQESYSQQRHLLYLLALTCAYQCKDQELMTRLRKESDFNNSKVRDYYYLLVRSLLQPTN